MRRRAILKTVPLMALASLEPVSQARATKTPDERIKDAMAEIEAALLEKRPGWSLSDWNKHSTGTTTGADGKPTRDKCEIVVVTIYPPDQTAAKA